MASLARAEQERRVPFDSPMTNASGSSTTSSPPLKQRVQEQLRMKSPQKMIPKTAYESQTRPKAPNLNLITNFTKSETFRPQGHKRKESIQERRNKARQEGSKGPIGNVKSADSRVSGLSPSDRTLVIGIALQPERVNAHRVGPVTHNVPTHQGITPEIVITPAAAENPWNSNDGSRPRSSVYSQATQYARGASMFGDIPLTLSAPPVPPLPSNASLLKLERLPVSATSWHTDLSEDEDRNALCRRYSGESQLGILRTKSIGNGARRHASKGWWNTLLSPLLDRSGTVIRNAYVKSTRKTEHPSSNEVHDQSRSPAVQEKEKESEKETSPQMDLTPWEENRHTLAFFNDSPTDTKRHADWQPRQTTLSPDFVSKEGFGEAAEYYEACWHDLHSPTPFFPCQNHNCRRLWYYRHGPVIGGPDAAYEAEQRALQDSHSAEVEREAAVGCRTMVVSPLDGPKSLDEDCATNAPKSPHVRNLSNDSEIDEEPDAASEVENARSFSSSKAPSPVPEIGTSHPQDINPSSRKAVSRDAEISAPPKPPIPDIPRSFPAGSPSTSGGVQTSQTRDIGPSSPPTLTPGMQREFSRNNAIPMQSTSSPLSKLEFSGGPLAINEPRAAPLPPQARTLDPAPVMSGAPAPSYWSPLGQHPVETHGGLGIETGDSPHRAPPVSAIHRTPGAERPEERLISQHRPVPKSPPQSLTNARNPMTEETEKQSREPKPKKTYEPQWKLTGCFSRPRSKKQTTKHQVEGKPKRKSKRKLYILIGGGLLAMVLLIVILVVTLTLKRSDIPVQSSWLNITGFPPIPTGIATIAQPSATIEDSQCVAPTTMWSCAVPKEQQSSISPNQPNQPNFRVEIRFQNGSAAINSTNSKRSLQPLNPVSAGQFIQKRYLRARDSFSSALFTPNPSPPSQEDQAFLGNTTDNNTTPFAGEATPFFISFLPTTPATSSKVRRQQSPNPSLGTNSTNPFPNVTVGIPPPSVNGDGTAAAANLYPFPSAQPLMLYNRGRSDEHYGFYTYFDRSIFLRSQDILNSTAEPNVPDDQNGGSAETSANVRCTWAQTRFLVQIFTNAGNSVKLLSSNSTNSTTSSQDSANDFSRPGSFPYPVSITLDRHGGDKDTKMIYYYGMDENEHIVGDEKQIHIEERGAGGTGLVNPSQGIFNETVVSTADGGPGGVDGGFGGCRCLWQNWAGS